MALVGNLDANFGGYFELFFIMPDVGNLFTNVGGYCWVKESHKHWKTK